MAKKPTKAAKPQPRKNAKPKFTPVTRVSYVKPNYKTLAVQQAKPLGRKFWQLWKPKFVYVITTAEPVK